MVCIRIAKPQTCKHCRKIPPIQKSYQKNSMQKKELETCFFYFYKGGKKTGTILHIAFSFKPVARFAGLGSRSSRARSPRTPRRSASSTEPSHARKTWIQEKAQNHAPPAFPNANNNQRSGEKKEEEEEEKRLNITVLEPQNN